MNAFLCTTFRLIKIQVASNKMGSHSKKPLRQIVSKTLTPTNNKETKAIRIKRYLLTMYVAAPGTPLKEGGTSLPGHLYYSICMHGSKSICYGFAPIRHGEMIGPGKVYNNDDENYINPLYARTIEIKEYQYVSLKNFGDNPKAYNFSMKYEHAKNNCVDFVWNALNKSNIKATLTYASALDRTGEVVNKAGAVMDKIGLGFRVEFAHEGDLKPIDNADSIASILPPFPQSELNKETKNPMPNRNFIQKLLSQNRDEKIGASNV